MLSSTSGPSIKQLPQRSQINNNGSYNITVLTSGDNNQVSVIQGMTTEEDVELDSLLDCYISKDALCTSFYSPPECHPNTRTTIRNEISGWIDDSGSNGSPLLWLNGPVGVGKSVIAKTISGSHDQVVATFFFSTSSDRSAATLFPTLAWQLARRIPETREHIITALKNDGMPQPQIEAQFDLLIVQPLKKTTLEYRPVMVVDGVDECTDESMLARFLRVLVQAGERGDIPVRFIICSRPEPRIHTILGMVSVLPGVDPTTNVQEPQSPRLVLTKLVVAMAIIGLIIIIAPSSLESPRIILSSSTELIALIASIVLIALIAFIALIILIPLIFLIVLIAIHALFVVLPSDSPSSDAHLPIPIMLGVFEPYKPVWFGGDKDALSFPTSDRHSDTPDGICRYPVISAIQIGFSKECRDDIARYLTDKFNAIHRSGAGIPCFQERDISDIVEASCGQFLYASTIVRLLDESHDLEEVLNMARNSCLPTPDLNKLYQAILTRAVKTIQDEAEAGGPDYQNERRFLMNSLAILVFFAGNVHFSTVRKSFRLIETLLDMESGKLTSALRKMHSVLMVVPEETIQVHHRSFLEFLQSRKRSGEYYIGYSKGLRCILILMARAQFRYLTIRLFRRSE